MLGPVETVGEIDSTNSELLRRARAGAPEGLVLVADHQTAGRGRLDRSWEAEPGSALLVSVLLRPALAVSRAHLVTFAAGLAAREACAAVAGVRPGLKWPNDLVADGGKLAGLLAESVIDGTTLSAVVVGMGLNLRSGSLPAGAVALDALAGREVRREDLLDAWLVAFANRYDALDGPTLLAEYRGASDTLGRWVRVELAGETIEGEATDVDDDGHLLVAVAGSTRVVTAGDVIRSRAVDGGDGR